MRNSTQAPIKTSFHTAEIIKEENDDEVQAVSPIDLSHREDSE
jgi:hypothetical protein